MAKKRKTAEGEIILKRDFFFFLQQRACDGVSSEREHPDQKNGSELSEAPAEYSPTDLAVHCLPSN